jgi:hypothetical protein
MDGQEEYELTRKRILEERKRVQEQILTQEAARAEREKRERELWMERDREVHEQRLRWAKNEMLIEKGQRNPFDWADGKLQSLWQVSDEEAEAWLRDREARRAQQ